MPANFRWPITIRRLTWTATRADAQKRGRASHHSQLYDIHQASIFCLYELGLLVTPEMVQLVEAVEEYWRDYEPDPGDSAEMNLWEAYQALRETHPEPDKKLLREAIAQL